MLSILRLIASMGRSIFTSLPSAQFSSSPSPFTAAHDGKNRQRDQDDGADEDVVREPRDPEKAVLSLLLGR